MASTSKKHMDFVGEPMGNKPVTDLPGVGKVIGAELVKQGYGSAKQLEGYHMQHGSEKTSELLKTMGADRGQRNKCVSGLKDWEDNHV